VGKQATMSKFSSLNPVQYFANKLRRMQVEDRSDLFCNAGQYRNPSYGRSLGSRMDGKLIVFGLPKSGNVWLVSMLCDYLDQPPIDPIVDTKGSGIGMCHLPFSGEIERRNDFIHGVYLIRDLRDVIISYFHHTKRDDFQKNFPNFHYYTLEHFYFQWFLPRIAPFHAIPTHAIEFAEKGIPVIRYEDLYADATGELSRLLRRLGLPCELARVRQIVESHSIQNMKKKGVSLDVAVPPEHFRQGGWGGFKTEMPRVVVQDVNNRFTDVLQRWGYEL
jgi:hypothetical protein